MSTGTRVCALRTVCPDTSLPSINTLIIVVNNNYYVDHECFLRICTSVCRESRDTVSFLNIYFLVPPLCTKRELSSFRHNLK